MGKIEQLFDRWFGRASGFATFWPLLPTGLFGVLSAYLSSGVGWITEHLGVWGWLMSGLAAFLLSALALALLTRARLWWYYSQHQKRLQSDSSNFDPMAVTYQDKRIFLRDLVPAGRRTVENRKFINCEIIGPGSIVVALRRSDGVNSLFSSNTYYDVDCIQIANGRTSNNAIYFPGCDFIGCNFYTLNLLFFEESGRTGIGSPLSADQQVLIEGPTNEKKTG